MKWIRNTVSLVLLSALIHGCAVNPVTGENEFSLISEAQEIAMGVDNYAPTQQMEGGIYNVDKELSVYVNSVGQRLAAVSDRPLPYEFVVLNNPVPNAWALPGGKIAVNSGLLLELNNEAELAAVLGHEVVHAAARHGAQSMTRGIFLQGALLATALTIEDNEYANYIMGAASVGAQLVNLKYGRDDELEADYYGMKYMVKAGYNPDAAIALQETFVRLAESKQQNWLEGLFSSHPPSPERVERNRQTRSELAVDGELGAEAYQQKMAALKKARPAYQALANANQALVKKDYDGALKSINLAISQEPREARFYGAKAEIYHSQGHNDLALQQYNQALARNPDWFQYYLGRGLVYLEQHNNQLARIDLEKSNSLLPNALAMNELGKIALNSGQRDLAKQYFETAANASGDIGEESALAFALLDIPDNPSRYLETSLFLDDEGYIVLFLLNRAPIDLKDISIVLVRDNGQSLLHSINHLAASQSIRLGTGIQATDTAELSGLIPVIRSASPAD